MTAGGAAALQNAQAKGSMHSSKYNEWKKSHKTHSESQLDDPSFKPIRSTPTTTARKTRDRNAAKTSLLDKAYEELKASYYGHDDDAIKQDKDHLEKELTFTAVFGGSGAC